MPPVPGSQMPNGGTPGTSADQGAASNATFGTRSRDAPLRQRSRPRAFDWTPARRGNFSVDRNERPMPRGRPRAELATNSDRSLEGEPVVLKSRRGERVSF